MSNYNGRKFNPAVRAICENHGWDVWFTYSDKRKDGRRVSFARNGAEVTGHQKESILKNVVALADEMGIKTKIYWEESLRVGYGYYDKFCVRVFD